MKPKNRFLLTLLLLSCSYSVFPVNIPGKDPATPEYQILKTLLIPGSSSAMEPGATLPSMVTIPLKRVGRLFVIEATIDNEIGNFLFDTGSQHLVLNSIYFRKYMVVEEISAGGVNGGTGATRTTVRRLDVAGIVHENIPADVTDLGHLENRRGIKIFGLFGFSLLRNMEVVIDANHNQLMLYRLDKTGRRLVQGLPEPRYDLTQKAELYQDVLFLKAIVGSKELNFCLDTGAESNVISSWLPRKVMDQVTIVRRSNLNGVGKNSADVMYGNLKNFVISNHSLQGMQVVVTSLESMSATYGRPLDGMLGFDFLQQGVISVNLVTREVKVAFNGGGKS